MCYFRPLLVIGAEQRVIHKRRFAARTKVGADWQAHALDGQGKTRLSQLRAYRSVDSVRDEIDSVFVVRL